MNRRLDEVRQRAYPLTAAKAAGTRALGQASETLRGCTPSMSVYRAKSLLWDVRMRLTPMIVPLIAQPRADVRPIETQVAA